MKVFVAAPLTENLDNEFLGHIEAVLKEINLIPVIPHYYVGKHSSLEDEIKHDFALLDGSDVLIAEVSKPSHGVGMEILYAHQKGKKVILLKKQGSKLSAMAAVHGHIIEYANLADLREKVSDMLVKG